MQRLNRTTAAAPARSLHFGLGNFHRAHQAVWTEEVDPSWGIAAVAPRSRDTVSKLREQEGLYSVTVRGSGEPVTTVCGALSKILHLTDDSATVEKLLSAPEITVVTLTITEKGYYRTPAGRLDLAAPDLAGDLNGGSDRTVIGAVTRGLAARHRASGAPLSVISCDNMAANGAALHGVVRDFAIALRAPDAMLQWLDHGVAWPDTVVDRIVPATAAGDADAASAVLGRRDEMPVAAEPYRQWVLQDTFAADRPQWEQTGALIVPDVTPYQLTKLRLLNGSHSALAYLGLALGLDTVAATMDTDWGPALVRHLAAEVAPTLPPGGPDPARYAEQLIERYRNPSIRHSLRQIATDGSRKLPERWFSVLREASSPIIELGLAGWILAAAQADDPLRDEFARNQHEHRNPTDLVAAQLRLAGAPDLADHAASVAAHLPALRSQRVDLPR